MSSHNAITRFFQALTLVTCITLLMSCGEKSADDSEYVELPATGWAFNDSLRFNFSADTIGSGLLTVTVDHNESYKYKNLWLVVNYASFDNEGHDLNRTDTIEILMADSAGQWIGKGVASNIQVESAPLKVRLNSSKPVYLKHIMSIDTVKDLNRIGLFYTSGK